MTAGVLDRPKLARVLGMLGSEHDGEVLAAAHVADTMVRKSGLSWAKILSSIEPLPLSVGGGAIDFVIDTCLARRSLLTEWERGFLRSLKHRRRYTLTQRQHSALAAIFDRLRDTGARAA